MATIQKNYIYNIILTVVNILFPIISFPYASRILGPEGIGKTHFITTFAGFFALVASLGIPIYGIREVAKIRHNQSELNKLFSELVLINIIGGIISLIIYLLAVFFVDRLKTDTSLYLYASFIIILGFSAVDWLYSGMEAFRQITQRSVVIKVCSLAFLFLFVHNANDVPAYLAITLFSILANNVWSLFMLKGRVSFTFNSLRLGKHLKPLLIIFGSILSISIYTVLDTVFLGFLSDNKSVGLYTAALKLNKITIPLVTALGTVLVPQMSQSIANGEEERFKELAQKSFNYIIGIGLPISLGLYLFAPEFIVVFSGIKFYDATFTMQLLAPLTLIIGLSNLFGIQMLTSARHDKAVFISVTLGMLCSVILNILLIPLMKQDGAALTTVISECLVTLMVFIFVRKYLSVKFNIKLLIQCIAVIALFVPILWLVRKVFISELWILLSGVSVCVTFYFFVQIVLLKNDLFISVLNNVIRKIKS